MIDPDDLHCIRCGHDSDELAHAAALRQTRITLAYQRLGVAVDWVRDHPDSQWNMPRSWLGA